MTHKNLKEEESQTYSINCVCAGFFADSAVTSEKMRWMGPARYFTAGAVEAIKRVGSTSLIKLKGAEGTGEAVTVDAMGLSLQTTRCFGNAMRFVPTTCLNNGAVDMTIVGNCGILGTTKMNDEMKLDGNHVYLDYVKVLRLEEVTVTPVAPRHIQERSKLNNRAENTSLDPEMDHRKMINIDGESVGRGGFTAKICPSSWMMVIPEPGSESDAWAAEVGRDSRRSATTTTPSVEST